MCSNLQLYFGSCFCVILIYYLHMADRNTLFLSIEVQHERMLLICKSWWYLCYCYNILYIYVCLYSTVPDAEDLNIPFVGKTTLKFGPAEQISFFRTHPEPGGYPYYIYYPSYISCTVDRTEANEENYLQHVSITDEKTVDSYYEWKLDEWLYCCSRRGDNFSCCGSYLACL